MSGFDTLKKIATLLIDTNSDILSEAERHLNDDDLVLFATILTDAGSKIADAAKFIAARKQMTIQDIEELGAVAQSLDDSGDPVLQKQASAIDELLMTIGSDPKARMAFKKAQDEEINRLRARYREQRGEEAYSVVKTQQDKENRVNEAVKAIDQKVKKYRPLEAPLSTRYSPDMPGVSLMRIGDNVYQCPVTKKIFDFRSGYTTAKGNKIPGGDVTNQTQHLGYQAQEHMNFSTREEALNGA